ncbi:response regulator [Kibdelosporangium aridum]|uniref:DNA-binding response regulator, NarL/FixJ family, contains REC and HTH domains n=1 Tax=Kibdelosporangium aridum TaxID=2030 RepID=A0A1W2D6I7_KIBAR|nr:response regulator transcription factor [Kibdelosporangium aridum]SMC92981.1 DNA-binding response regulator, NarL/FixJ family, contains REC and HTH domains [Kibdelosporangium aridum]
MITVLICDDAPIVRMGLRMAVESEPDLSVVGEAADGAEAVAATKELQPDVVLLDIRMPRVDGIEAARQILAEDTKTRVLVLTTYDHDDNVYAALRAGASGFLVKDAPPEHVIEAIRAIDAGDAVLSPSVTRRLLDTVALPGGVKLPELSEQDSRLLRLIAKGRTNAEIAAELDLTPATVKTYVSRLFTKINARDRTQAVVLAYESGLVRPGS